MSAHCTNSSLIRVSGGEFAQLADYNPGSTVAPADAIKAQLWGTTVYVCEAAQNPKATRLELLHSGRAVLDQLIEALSEDSDVTNLTTPSAGSAVASDE